MNIHFKTQVSSSILKLIQKVWAVFAEDIPGVRVDGLDETSEFWENPGRKLRWVRMISHVSGSRNRHSTPST